MRTLERLGVHEALSDDLGFRGPSGIPQIYRYKGAENSPRVSLLNPCRHWKSNQIVSVDTHTKVSDRRHLTTRFHRGHLHAALLGHVPKSSIHLNKRIARADVNQNDAVLFFEDGTEAHGDILIAADGIRSVRGIATSHCKRQH